MYNLTKANKIKTKRNAFKASLFPISKINNYYIKH